MAVLIHFVCASVPAADKRLKVELMFTVIPPVVLLQPVAVSVKVNVAVPAARPVTTPSLSTEATAGLLLTHVPPVAGDKDDVLPTQIAVGPVKLTDGASIVTVIVELLLTHSVVLFLIVSVPV